ncbi:hypothetical protein CLAIMM_05186 [Cladophialophora immunda]|nr:hypothetical protein CLAIMM_05186 [Cladophialophora immunda]
MAYTNGVTNGVSQPDHTAIVIRAGISGVRMLYELRKRGIDGKCFEAGSGVGGTWFWNRYPGARADSEVWIYIISFLEDIGMQTKWKERFPTQRDLEAYLNQVVDFLDLRRNIEFNTRVASAHYDEARNFWKVTTAHGLWPDRKVDFTNKRIGIFGTGATGVQIIPIVAHAAQRLTVFQRTPNYVLPGRNFLFTEDQECEIKNDFRGIAERARAQPFGADIPVVNRSSLDIEDDETLRQILDYGWERGGFRYVFETVDDMMTNADCNKKASEFLCQKIRAIVQDPATAETLCPYYPLMCKRPPLGHFYYETFNRANVELVDLKKDPVQEITPTGARTLSKEFELDSIIFAIGFDAVTGPLDAIDIRGTDGQYLKDYRKTNLETAYGITHAGFPNLFMILGPQSAWANLPTIVDHTADWIGRTIQHMRVNGLNRIETKKEVARAWAEKVDRAFSSTLMEEGAKQTGAWHVGGNVEDKTVRCYYYYFGGVPQYIAQCEDEISSGYPGYTFSNASM